MFTLEQVRNTAEEVVLGNEDFVYTDSNTECQYAKDGHPSCLVGKILFKLGVPIQNLEVLDTKGICGDSPSFMSGYSLDYLESIDFTFDDDGVIGYLDNLQSEQDSGTSWGKALEKANNELSE